MIYMSVCVYLEIDWPRAYVRLVHWMRRDLAQA